MRGKTSDVRIEELKKILKKQPKNSSVLKKLGRFYLSARNYKEAENYYKLAALFNPHLKSEIELDFENILETDPENKEALNSLISFYLSQNDINDAIFELEEFIDIAPWATDAYNILGQIHLKLDHLDESISLLEKSLKYGISDLALSEMLAGAYLEKGKEKEAINMYEGMIKLEPKNKLKLRILGDLYRRNKNYDSAATCYFKMIEDDPEVSAEICDKLKALDGEAKNNFQVKKLLSHVYIKCLKPDQAVEKYEEMLGLAPQKLDDIIKSAKKILQYYPEHQKTMEFLSKCLIQKGSYSEAIEYLNKILKLDFKMVDTIIDEYKRIIDLCPNQVLAHSSLAQAYIDRGNIETGLLEFRKVSQLNPHECENIAKKCRDIIKDNPKMTLAYQVSAEINLNKGDFKKAIDTAEDIINIDKNFLPAYLILGEGYKSIGMYSKAIEAFKNVLKFEPYDISIHEKLKTVSFCDMDKEIESLTSKIEHDPWRISLHLDLGKLLLKRGHLSSGIKELQVATKDQQKLTNTYNLLGTAFKELGKFDLAQVQFQKALENVTFNEDESISKKIRSNLAAVLEAQGKIAEALPIYENIYQEDVEFKEMKKKIKYLSSTNPSSIRNKTLIAFCSVLGGGEIMAVWARDWRKIKSQKRENAMLVSFGQNNNNTAFDLFIKERYKAAEEEAMLAIGLDPKHPAALNNLALIYLKDGRLELAQTKLKEALEEDPALPALHNNLGLTYFLARNFDEAQKQFNIAIKEDKNLAVPYINLADLLYLSGNAKEAITNWRVAAECEILNELILRRIKYKVL